MSAPLTIAPVLAGSPGPTSEARCCVICGGPLEGLDQTAVVCGAKCRGRRRRLIRVLAGEDADSYRTVADLVRGLEMTCKEPTKRRPASRTDVARRFLADFVMQVPGEMVPAESIHAAYLRWHQERGDGSLPLSRAAFDELVRRLELAERVDHEHTGGRGRPRTVFVGIRLADPLGLP